ncbi:FAD-dependent oxidoreductase [Cellulomonas xylanilytica]|uniref:N-methyltryptophan oxidase n=1 Tax=Cellulomonas xylanilytica TaxID=233583 RepID=A0A510V2H5_9CELL|nr:FAD-dependent oxidoreductase [Cellulomonas xylanilytica]GEK21092.1 N-methyltryptophan oxidase [Cellulomonas xylanilytica]
MSEHVDHVVVGGGVMGAATAWQLARRGRQVVLLERFGRGHSWGASHGASRIYRNTYARPEYLDLVQEAFDLWRVLEDEAPTVGELLRITGGVSHGSLASREVADAFVERGIPHEWLSAADAHARWPGLAFEGDVLHETDTAGRLHADRAVEAFLQAAADAGARVLHETPVRLIEQNVYGVRVVTDTGTWDARRVVVAAGAWTAGLLTREPDLDGAARRLVVTQEQPAHFALRPDAPAAELWPSFTHDPAAPHRWPSGVYGLATPGEGIKVGFHGVGPRTDPDQRTFTAEPGQLRQLRDYVARWVPGADPDHLVPVSCTYTTTPDHDFVLDRRGSVVVAAGFSGHGFKFAPAVGRVLADLASEPADAPVRAAHPAFAAARLAALPA